ncbi:MAG: flavin reductase family protein [Actinomycetota bacterium]|nr:flavin reductase family protein [Actinomycetota bacterium]
MTAEDDFAALTDELDYPMFIVTAVAGAQRAGCLVGFATQCSIDPLRFLVCLSVKNHTARVAGESAVLAVHIVTSEAVGLAELFGTETGDTVDKFDRCEWVPGPEGVPLLVDLPDRFVGRVIDRLALGDHEGFVLRVVEASSGAPGGPVTFQRLRHLEPGHPA